MVIIKSKFYLTVSSINHTNLYAIVIVVIWHALPHNVLAEWNLYRPSLILIGRVHQEHSIIKYL